MFSLIDDTRLSRTVKMCGAGIKFLSRVAANFLESLTDQDSSHFL